MIPSIKACLELMDTYKMLENIRAHSVVVAKVAHLIARNLNLAGMHISLEKVTAGALLHDIGKTQALGSGLDHSQIGKEICMKHHLQGIADIVGEHVRLKVHRPNGNVSEKEIVYYSDKRVNHDRIVSLEERLAYILDRYGKDRKGLTRAIVMNFEHCKSVEKKLFTKLPFPLEELPARAEGEDIGLIES